MWEDEEERRFYEDVIDLREFVPGGILGVKEKVGGGEGTNTEEEKKKDGDEEEGMTAREEEEERERKEAEDVKRQLEKMDEGAATGGSDNASTTEASRGEDKKDEVETDVSVLRLFSRSDLS